MARKALLIGCNYPGTKAELKGCINDVRQMHRCLVERYGFSEDNITVLNDVDDSYVQPTGKNIRCALTDLIWSAEPGDFLFVHYSGHGTRFPAAEEDDTGYHECIVPRDMNLITDDDFREFVDQVPEGCRLTIVSDSCHSGGLIEQAKEQIGESTRNQEDGSSDSCFGFTSFPKQNVQDKLESRGIHIPSALCHHRHHGEEEKREVESADGDRGYVKSRSLPPSTLIEILKQKTGKDNIDIGKLRPALFDIFREDASPTVKFPKVILNKLQHGHGDGEGGGGFMDESDEGYAKPAMEVKVGSYQEVYAATTKRSFPDGGILISACQTDQFAVEVCPSGNAHEAYGVLTNAILTLIANTDGAISNQDLVMRAREMLESQGFTQRPGLYCRDDHVDAPFIC